MATLYRSTKIHGFFNRLIPASSSMSPRYQHRLSHRSLRIITPRSISNHVASPYCVSSHLLHYLASRHRISLSHLFSTSASCAPSSSYLHPALVYFIHVIIWGYYAYPTCARVSPLHQSAVLISQSFTFTRIPRRCVLVFDQHFFTFDTNALFLVCHSHRIASTSTSLLSSYRLYRLVHGLAGARPKKGGYCHKPMCLKPESSDGNLVQPLNVALYLKQTAVT